MLLFICRLFCVVTVFPIFHVTLQSSLHWTVQGGIKIGIISLLITLIFDDLHSFFPVFLVGRQMNVRTSRALINALVT